MSSAQRQPVEKERRAQPREADIIAMPMPVRLPVYEQESQQHTERVGDVLRRTRQRRGDELQPIADYLCIRRGFLEALEESRYEAFPADAYVIGFLRSYAELLGLDGPQVINAYRAEMTGRRKKPSLVLPTPIQEGRSPSAFVLIGAIVAAILIYVVWYSLSTSDRASVSVAPTLPSATSADTNSTNAVATSPAATAAPAPQSVIAEPPPPKPVATSKPVSLQPATADTATDATTSAQEAAPAAPPKPPHLVIKAEQSSWVLISDSKGVSIFDRVLKPGETFQVPDKPGLNLTTGNGVGIVLTVDGVDLPKLSSKPIGTMRNISLSAAHLKSLATPRD